MTRNNRHCPGIPAIDAGGTQVKVRATGRKQRIEIPSDPKMTSAKMAAAVRAVTAGCDHDASPVG